MSKKYQIDSTPIDTLILQSRTYGVKHTMQYVYKQLEEIKLKNREIKYLIKLHKLKKYINNFSKYKDKELYFSLLADLKNIPLAHIKEYRILIYFLKSLVASIKK